MKQSQPMQLLTSRTTTEWYTPPWLIELAKEVLGAFELDPASAPMPQTWIQASRFYTKEENGLSLPWHGRVWLNPPFDNSAIWARVLINEYLAGNVHSAILLINSNLGYKWYEEIWEKWLCCCLRERVAFVNETGWSGAAAKRAQTIVYLGQDKRKFAMTFAKYGRIIQPDEKSAS